MKKLVALFIICFAVPTIAFALNAYGHEVPKPGNITLLGIDFMGIGLACHQVRASG